MVTAVPARPQPLRRSLLTGSLGALAVLAPLAGVAVAWNGATRGSTLAVPVAPLHRGTPALQTLGSTEAVTVHGTGLHAGIAFVDHPTDVPLAVLAASGPALAGITVGLLALLLVGVVRSLAAREPFTAGNSTRLAGAGGVLLAASAVGSVLPYLAARRLLELPYVDATGWRADLDPVLWPVPVAVLLLVLAAAVRAGARLQIETEGLV